VLEHPLFDCAINVGHGIEGATSVLRATMAVGVADDASE
jgi:hypothetical protein